MTQEKERAAIVRVLEAGAVDCMKTDELPGEALFLRILLLAISADAGYTPEDLLRATRVAIDLCWHYLHHTVASQDKDAIQMAGRLLPMLLQNDANAFRPERGGLAMQNVLDGMRDTDGEEN